MCIYYRDIPERHFQALTKAGWLEKSKLNPEVFYILSNPPPVDSVTR